MNFPQNHSSNRASTTSLNLILDLKLFLTLRVEIYNRRGTAPVLAVLNSTGAVLAEPRHDNAIQYWFSILMQYRDQVPNDSTVGVLVEHLRSTRASLAEYQRNFFSKIFHSNLFFKHFFSNFFFFFKTVLIKHFLWITFYISKIPTNREKKIWKDFFFSNLEKKFKTTISITKLHNNINRCITVAVLGASTAPVLRQHSASTPPVLSSQMSVVMYNGCGILRQL